MAHFWNERALEDPQHFILSGVMPYGEPNDQAFFHSGERDVERFLNRIGYQPSGADRLLEIGCGAGRMTRAFAQRFGAVSAIDISDEMIELGRKNLAAFPNVEIAKANGVDLRQFSDACFDFCFSYIVFQHIPDPAITIGYIQEIGRVLAPGGQAYFQVNTLPRSRFDAVRNYFRIRTRLDHILKRNTPRTRYDSAAWRGSTLTEGEIRHALTRAGLHLVGLDGLGKQYTWVHAMKGDTDYT